MTALADPGRIGEYEIHPLASIFAEPTDLDLEVLTASVRATGQLRRILRHRGCVIDGCAVLRACLGAGLPPRFEDLPDDADPLEVVLAANLDRRHLTRSQRAVAAARVATLPPGRPETGQRCTYTVAAAAERFGVSPRLVKSARMVLRRRVAPLTEAVERGAVSVSRAARLTPLDDAGLVRLMEQIRGADGAKMRDLLIRLALEEAGIEAARPAEAPSRRMKVSLEVLAAHVRCAEEPAVALGGVLEDLAKQAGLRLQAPAGGLLAVGAEEEQEQEPGAGRAAQGLSLVPLDGADDVDEPRGRVS